RRRRRKKEEKVGSAKGRKKTPPEEYLDFKPPESPGFRIGVHNLHRVRRYFAARPGIRPADPRGFIIGKDGKERRRALDGRAGFLSVGTRE
ncbi:MAG: hypothetical protein AB7J34_03460, partial [Limisphaerales bacterium]